MTKGKDSNAINKLRRCAKKGCLTDPVMCRPWMCPDCERGKS
jgi:hypothetical protein